MECPANKPQYFTNLKLLLAKRYYWTVFLSIFFFWLGILLSSDSIFSGYHFIDDHLIVDLHQDFVNDKRDFWQVLIEKVVDSITVGKRFIFYHVGLKVIQAKLFGLNLILWSTLLGFFAVFTNFFLFTFATLVGFSVVESLVFPLLIMLGTQSATWWRLSYAEASGTLFLSLSLVLLGLNLRSIKTKWLYEIGFFIAILLMTFSKESFVLITPAIAFARVWLFQHLKATSWREAIQRNFLPVLGLLVICISEILFIKYFIGLQPKIAYAGVDNINPWGAIGVLNSYTQAGFQVLIFVGLLLVGIALKLQTPTSKQGWQSLAITTIACLTLFALILLPQVILHAKSGVSQRYLLPGIFAYALLLIWMHRYIHVASKLLSRIFLGLIVASLVIKLNLVWHDARTFALDGKATTALLQSIATQTNPKDNVLVITNPRVYEEWNLSIRKYLTYVSHRPNVYVGAYSGQQTITYQELEKFYGYKTLERIQDKSTFQCVVVFPGLNKSFLRNTKDWFTPRNYNLLVFEPFYWTINPQSQVYLYCKKPA